MSRCSRLEELVSRMQSAGPPANARSKCATAVYRVETGDPSAIASGRGQPVADVRALETATVFPVPSCG